MATQGTRVQITMPAMGESVTEGTVLEWLKQVGDTVAVDEPIVEVSTDKVDAEVPSPAAGVLAKILVGPDETVQVGQALGEIESADGPAAAEAPAPPGRGARPTATTPDRDSAGETVEVTFPEMGDSVAEGTILEWRVKPGDTVAVDDPLVEISTDKVDAEVPSPVAGTVAELLVEPDETVPVGTVLCRIEAGAGAPAQAAPAAQGRGGPPGNGRAAPRSTATPTPRPWPRGWRRSTASTWAPWAAAARAGA